MYNRLSVREKRAYVCVCVSIARKYDNASCEYTCKIAHAVQFDIFL